MDVLLAGFEDWSRNVIKNKKKSLPPLCHKLDRIFSILLVHAVYSDFCAAITKAKWVNSTWQNSVNQLYNGNSILRLILLSPLRLRVQKQRHPATSSTAAAPFTVPSCMLGQAAPDLTGPTHLIKTSERRAVPEAVNVPIIYGLLYLGGLILKGSGGDMEHGRNRCRGGFSWALSVLGFEVNWWVTGCWSRGRERTNRGVAIWPREKTASVLKFKGHRYKNTFAL